MPSFGVQLSPVNLRDAGEIERTVNAFTRGPNSALVVTDGGPSKFIAILIITLAARYRLRGIRAFTEIVAIAAVSALAFILILTFYGWG
jgi:putative tryptophan/tyrosine transport system substrate-binding protein